MTNEVSFSADGKTVEFDVPAILRKFGLEDTEENRDQVVEILRQVTKEQSPKAEQKTIRKKSVANVLVFLNGLVGVFDQHCHQMSYLQGKYPRVKTKILRAIDEKTKFELQNFGEISKEQFENLHYYEASEFSRMPRIYKPPMGLPFFWMDCLDEKLSTAIQSYFDHKSFGDAAPSQEQIEILTDYLDHHIHAPCWLQDEENEFAPSVKKLRETVKNIKTVADIDAHVLACMDCCIDPF